MCWRRLWRRFSGSYRSLSLPMISMTISSGRPVGYWSLSCFCYVSCQVITDNYRPQTKFAKVMFLQMSVCPLGGGMRGWGGGVHGWGACVAGGMHAPPPSATYYGYGIRSMSGRYVSYWNAFLLERVKLEGIFNHLYFADAECMDEKERVQALYDIIKKLPQPNYDLFERLVFHLAK